MAKRCQIIHSKQPVRGATGSCKWVTFPAGWPTCLHPSRGGFSYSQTVPDTRFFVCFSYQTLSKDQWSMFVSWHFPMSHVLPEECSFSVSLIQHSKFQLWVTNPTLEITAMRRNNLCDFPGKSQNSEFGMPSILFETSSRLMTDVSSFQSLVTEGWCRSESRHWAALALEVGGIYCRYYWYLVIRVCNMCRVLKKILDCSKSKRGPSETCF